MYHDVPLQLAFGGELLGAYVTDEVFDASVHRHMYIEMDGMFEDARTNRTRVQDNFLRTPSPGRIAQFDVLAGRFVLLPMHEPVNAEKQRTADPSAAFQALVRLFVFRAVDGEIGLGLELTIAGRALEVARLQGQDLTGLPVRPIRMDPQVPTNCIDASETAFALGALKRLGQLDLLGSSGVLSDPPNGGSHGRVLQAMFSQVLDQGQLTTERAFADGARTTAVQRGGRHVFPHRRHPLSPAFTSLAAVEAKLVFIRAYNATILTLNVFQRQTRRQFCPTRSVHTAVNSQFVLVFESAAAGFALNDIRRRRFSG